MDTAGRKTKAAAVILLPTSDRSGSSDDPPPGTMGQLAKAPASGKATSQEGRGQPAKDNGSFGVHAGFRRCQS
jgi:hypothetical protein